MDGFAARLIEVRRMRNMTQAELAERLGISRSTVSSWERGRTAPDLNALRRLSAVLDYDFIHGAGPNATAPEAEVPEADAPEVSGIDAPDVPKADAPEVPGNGEDVPAAPPVAAKPRPRRRLILAGVAVLLIAAVVCAVVLLRRPAKDTFNPEDYRVETRKDPERAYFTFENRTWEEGEGDSIYARYAFTMQERNGKPFSVTRVVANMESLGTGGVRVMTLEADMLRQAGLETEIGPNGSFMLDGGFPKGEFGQVGIVVYGTDADGRENVFYDLIHAET